MDSKILIIWKCSFVFTVHGLHTQLGCNVTEFSIKTLAVIELFLWNCTCVLLVAPLNAIHKEDGIMNMWEKIFFKRQFYFVFYYSSQY